jgi:hypothetical protein
VIQERLEGWKGALDRVTATVEKSLAVSSGAGASQKGSDFLLLFVEFTPRRPAGGG